jgi:signal transduction histidine kinase
VPAPNAPRRLSPVALTTLVTVLAAVATAALTFMPVLRFAYQASAVHVMLETVSSLIAMLVALLVYGRFRRSSRRDELLLICSMAVVAAANLVLAAIPAALSLSGPDVGATWAPLATRVVATLLLAAAALTSPETRVTDRRALPAALLLAAFVTGLAITILLAGSDVPALVDPAAVSANGTLPRLTVHPVAVAIEAVFCVLYATAAVAFTRRAARTHDELLRWVGAACAVSAFARVNYLYFPSLYTDYVYAGDLLRLAYYLLLLVGAVSEIRAYWATQLQAAVLDDRRRLARDLHDGLTQELTYIWGQSRLLTKRPGDLKLVDQINAASGRALDEARTAIVALTRTTSSSFAEVIRQVVDGLSSRYDVTTSMDVDASAAPTPEQADALLRIVAEAFRNAVRHGGATMVEVTVSVAPLSVVVRDDGAGFEAAGSADGAAGFGLTSMRERARAVGADLEIASSPGSGTMVRVRWP